MQLDILSLPFSLSSLTLPLSRNTVAFFLFVLLLSFSLSLSLKHELGCAHDEPQ